MKKKKTSNRLELFFKLGKEWRAFWENWQLHFYYRLSRFSLTKYFVWDVRKRYEIMKPASEKVIVLSTMKVLHSCFLAMAALVAFAATLKGASVYTWMIWCSLVYMVIGQIVKGRLWNEEYILLVQLEKYLGDVRHYYHVGGMVEEAVYDSMEAAPYEISLHMQKIYEVLAASDSFEEEGELEHYKEMAPNKFLKTFVALCQITMEYGDTIKDGKSLFLTNLNYLRNEIHIELLKRDKIRYTFSGLILITILPVFFLKVIEDWGISNLPELASYYHGSYGILVSVAIFLTTVFAYVLIGTLKQDGKVVRTEHRYLQKLIQLPFVNRKLEDYFFKYPKKVHRTEQLLHSTGNEYSVGEFLIQKWLLFFGTILISLIIFFHIADTEKYNAVYELSDFQGVTLINQKETIEWQKELIQAGVEAYKEERDFAFIEEKIRMELEKFQKAHGEAANEVLLEEIMARIERYQNSGFHWYYILFSILAGAILCQTPWLIFEIKRYFLKGVMEDEVMQFQTMIVMLMYIPRMNVEIILEWMESFSEIFKPSLMECVDMYSYDEELALHILKEKETFPPFTRLLEDLLACDRVGIEAAFDEIVGQRAYFTEKRKQDNEIQISNKGVIGRIAAYMPMVLVIGFYLIVPFVMESLSQFNGYIIQMEIF